MNRLGGHWSINSDLRPQQQGCFLGSGAEGTLGGYRGLGRVGARHPIFREDCKLPLASGPWKPWSSVLAWSWEALTRGESPSTTSLPPPIHRPGSRLCGPFPPLPPGPGSVLRGCRAYLAWLVCLQGPVLRREEMVVNGESQPPCLTTIPQGTVGSAVVLPCISGAAGSPAPRCLGGGPAPVLTCGLPLLHCLSGL